MTESADERLATRTLGEAGPRVVFVHGLFGQGRNWTTLGKGLADQYVKNAKTQGLNVVANEGIDTKAANFRSVAQKIRSSGADCFFSAHTAARLDSAMPM